MQVNLTTKEFRRLLDLVYIGNWVLNSIRGSDRFSDYDQVESKLFGLCRGTPLDELAEVWDGNVVPSRAFNDGGIQEAIVNYEDAVFFDVLAEELARRDMGYPQITRENYDDLVGRMEDYLEAVSYTHLSLPASAWATAWAILMGAVLYCLAAGKLPLH